MPPDAPPPESLPSAEAQWAAHAARAARDAAAAAAAGGGAGGGGGGETAASAAARLRAVELRAATPFPMDVRIVPQPTPAPAPRGGGPPPRGGAAAAPPPPPPARQLAWLRAPPSPAGGGCGRPAGLAAADGSALDRCVAAYGSDFALLDACLVPHAAAAAAGGWRGGRLTSQMASLDHAVWFHAPFSCEGWMLYDCESHWAGHGRGLAIGRLFQGGRLVATVVQEGLIRPREGALRAAAAGGGGGGGAGGLEGGRGGGRGPAARL